MKRWIGKGYAKAVVVDFVSLAVSTYYHHITDKESVVSPKKPVGQKRPRYSFNSQGNKMPDEIVKEHLLELVCGDGFPYGYGKLTNCLQESYGLMINHKKIYRLCKELDILRPHRKICYEQPRKLAEITEVTGPNQHWKIDLKYCYITGHERIPVK